MRILLLRKEEEDDKYKTKFIENEFHDITQLPVLDFTFCNVEKINSVTQNLSDYAGLIFTSKRAVDIFVKSIDSGIIREIKEQNYPIYVVGRSCEEPLLLLGFQTLGRDTGNADELAELITSQNDGILKPLVFFCGNIARETIPKRLKEENIPLESITCYYTVANKDFIPSFRRYIDNGIPDFIVFFSPSGVEFHFDEIEKLIVDFSSVKIACIGKTTESAVLKQGKQVSAVASKPNPDSLIASLKSCGTI